MLSMYGRIMRKERTTMNKIIDEKGISGSNYKYTSLIFNRYRPRDFIIIILALAWGIIGFIMLLIFYTFNPLNLIIYVSVPLTVFVLVQPLPHYHNYLEYLILTINFNIKPKVFSRILKKKNSTKRKLLKK